MPVLSALPYAYFVNGDTGLKQTTKVAWENKYLNVEEIATIVPIPEAVIDDADFDLWAQIRPLISEAVGRALDDAVFFGTNKPATWPSDIEAGARAAGNVQTFGASSAGDGGIAEDYNELFGKVEEDGYEVDAAIARTNMRKAIRGARGTDGQPLADLQNGRLFGTTPLQFVLKGLWPDAAGAGTFGIHSIVGDFTQGIVGVRQDLDFKMLDQSALFDNTGALMINLPQQDAVALRVKARFAFQIANPINRENMDGSSRYPFGIMQTAGV
jgi:HK97 family phage major capsid protein